MLWEYLFGTQKADQSSINDKSAICGGLPFRNRPLEDPQQLQSVEIESKEKIRRSVLCGKEGLWKVPPDAPQTILACFENGLKISRDRVVCGLPQSDGTYKTITYAQLNEDIQKAAKAFQKMDLLPKEDKFAIFSQNCYQYDAAILGGYYRNLCNVSLYDTLGNDAVRYILNHIEAKCVFVGDEKKLDAILEIAEDLHFLQFIVTFEESASNKTNTNHGKIKIISWEEFLSSGADVNLVEKKPSAKDIATINYTSGTTGNPKGAVLSHENVTTLALGIITWFLPQPIGYNERWFSYLPMAHVFERSVRCIIFTVGAQFWFSSGNLLKLLDELAIVQPTVFGTVPRVTNRLYDRIKAAMAESPSKNWLISSAQSAKRNLLNRGIVTRETWWDYFVLSKIQKLVGGKVHTWVSGAAPLDPKVRSFVREIFGCHVIESYGTTENVGCGCATTFTNFTVDDGSVGPPQPWNEVKLVSVPEMDYFAEDNCGEICFRGANTMLGYFKEPEKTRETIDNDGWLHTGDIGRWDQYGNLHIFDRKKNIYKLAQGEYIAPEKIEGVLGKHPLVEQIFVWGSSYHHFNVAVLVLSKEVLRKKFGSESVSLESDELLAWVHAEIEQYGRSEGLKGFEIPKRIIMEQIAFTVDNGLLTPTQKAKRPAIYKKYKQQIDDLYNK